MPTLTIEGEVNDMVRETYEPVPTSVTGPVNSVYGKVVSLMSVVTKVTKDKTNDFHKYSYASNVAVLSAVREEMVKLHLIYVPKFQVIDSTDDKSAFVVEVVGRIIDADTGDFVEVTALGAGSDKGDKHVQKGQTAADKYLWLKFLMLPTPDDPEADTATDARVAPNVSQPESKGNSGAIGVYENAKVTEVRTPTGKGPHIIVTDKGQLNTFDKDIIAQASLAQASGLLTRFVYKETKWGKDVVKEKANGERTDG